MDNVWVWTAFNRLSTTRQGGLGMSAISYLDVLKYADHLELSPGLQEFLWDAIRRIDTKYMKMVADRNKPKPQPPGRR